MRLYGLDEAALGPRLGPFCACLTRFEIDSSEAMPHSLYHLLQDSVARAKNRDGLLAVGDSKSLYSSSTGIRLLEEGVLAFLDAAGLPGPETLGTLIARLAPPEDRIALKGTPWFAEVELSAIPWPEELAGPLLPGRERRLEALHSNLESAGIVVRPPRIRFVPAMAFNQAIDSYGGKGGAVQSIIAPLIAEALTEGGADEGRIIADRQGGRRYYGEWLAGILPGGPLLAGEEGPVRSVYRAGRRDIEFLVKADARHAETALASMVAKYVRETAMTLFNAWWARRVPGIRPTAGYPEDARRFLAGLEAAGALPADSDILSRKL